MSTSFSIHRFRSEGPSAHVGVFHLGWERGRPDAVGLEGEVLDDLRAHVLPAGLHLPPLELDVRPHAPPVQLLDGADVVGERRLGLFKFGEGRRVIFANLDIRYMENGELYSKDRQIFPYFRR